MKIQLSQLIFFAGIFQIILVIGSLLIPKLLNWESELSKVSKLIKQMFWTYAGYILVINLSFGIISIVLPNDLINKTSLAKAITLFIFMYWFARILIQFFYFDRSQAPKGFIYFWGEVGLVTLFIILSSIYGYAFYINF